MSQWQPDELIEGDEVGLSTPADDTRTRTTPIVLWIAAAVGFVASVAFVVRGMIANVTFDFTALGGTLWDFRDAGYYPVRAVLDSVVPYDVGRYFHAYPVGQEFPLLPPFYLVIHAPFQLLDLPAASAAAFGASLLGIVLLVAWCLKLARYRVTPVAILGVSALVIASNGGRNLLFTGQASALFAAGAYLAITAESSSSGSVGIFASLIKPAFGLPVTLLVAASGRVRRAVFGTIAAATVSVVLMAPMVIWAGGVSEMIDILRENASFSADSPWVALATTTARIDLSATIAMLSGQAIPDWAQVVVAILVFGGTAVVLVVRRASIWVGHRGDVVVVAICAATLVGFYHSFYDLILLLLPAVLLSRSDFGGGNLGARRYVMLGAVLFAGFNPFRLGPIVDVLADQRTLLRVLSPGLTGLALVVVLAVAIIVILQGASGVTGHIGSAESDQVEEPWSRYDVQRDRGA